MKFHSFLTKLWLSMEKNHYEMAIINDNGLYPDETY